MKANPIVFIHGEESFLIDRELRDIEAECQITSPDDMNRQVLDAAEADASTVAASARTMPFMGGRKLIIVKNAGAWSASAWESLSRYLEKPNPSTCLVLVADKVDKRRAYYKLIKEKGREFEAKPPADADLMRWAGSMAKESGLDLDPRVAQSIVMRVGPDLQTLWREIQKLAVFAGGGRLTVDDVEKLVGDSRGTNVFALCDAIGAKNLREAVKALRKLLELGEPPVLLVYMIARHFRILAKARQIRDEDPRAQSGYAAQRMGVAPFVAKKAMDQASNWGVKDLERAFRAMLLTDMKLKSGGGDEVVERLVMDLCAKQK